MRCPTLIARTTALDGLRARIGRVAEGDGGLVAIVGDAGVGKTRLLAEVGRSAAAAGLFILTGRSVEHTSPIAYRPLTEAFLSAFRTALPPDDPMLDGFRAHLGRLVPAWSVASATDVESPIMVGEAIIRLLRVAGGAAGAVLVVEDVHWADPETVAVLDYIADAAVAERVLCICSSRPAGAARAAIERAVRRDPTSSIALEPLDEDATELMVAACLDVASPPAGLAGFVCRHSDGNPFLVEELLAGMVASGDLRIRDGTWEISELRTTVPPSLRDSIERRLGKLDATARRVIGAAAMLGREFGWELLPGIAAVDGRAVVDALRAAVDEQLIDAAGSDFVFRHALTREAVFATLLPPERRELAARAWPVVERAHPGLPGQVLELAAELAEAAGDAVSAGRMVLTGARRALAAGALATAEATARRARRLLIASECEPEATLALLDVLVAAGKVTEALDLGALGLGAGHTAAPDAAHARALHLTLARAAITAGDLEAAMASIASARAVPADDGSWQADIDVVAAHIALDSGQFLDAAALASRARDAARSTHRRDVECDAQLVLGRVVRTHSWADSVELFEQAALVAERAQLPSWHLRAQRELALAAWADGNIQLLHDTRDLAARYGAMDTVAVVDLSLADIALSSFDASECLRAATACATASRRYRLATEPVAELWLAGAHALAGDDDAMQRAIDAALAPDPDDPRILGDLFGRILPMRAMLRDELADVRPLLDTMAGHIERASRGTSVYPGRILRAISHTADGTFEAAAARAALAEMAEVYGLPVFRIASELAEAMELGRVGDTESATQRFERAYDALAAVNIGAGQIHVVIPFVAPTAARDGWGDPARWLRAAEAYFADLGHDRLARRCRLLLGEIGAPMPRRGRGETIVPAELRARGVTGRELDVLRLIVAGRTNREIADALIVSPKTVERHVSNLFGRLSVGSRAELVRVVAPHLRDTDA